MRTPGRQGEMSLGPLLPGDWSLQMGRCAKPAKPHSRHPLTFADQRDLACFVPARGVNYSPGNLGIECVLNPLPSTRPAISRKATSPLATFRIRRSKMTSAIVTDQENDRECRTSSLCMVKKSIAANRFTMLPEKGQRARGAVSKQRNHRRNLIRPNVPDYRRVPDPDGPSKLW